MKKCGTASGESEMKIQRVLLVNPNQGAYVRIPLGVAYISACLKRKKFETSLFDTCFSVKGDAIKDFEKRIEQFKPDAIGISCREEDFEEALALARIAKEKNKLVVWGGVHATTAADEIIKEEGVDVLCIGEGDEAMPELFEKINKGKNHLKTKNVWFKRPDGTVIKNDVRNLRNDLDYLPMPDFDVFLNESDKFQIRFMSSRGCPNQCNYCINAFLQKLYLGKGRYVRFMSVDKVLDEVEYSVKRYGLKEVKFCDDVFTINKNRVLEFADKYKKRIDLPLWVITRANYLDYEVLKALKDAGLQSMSIGVESGNEFIRNKVFNRNMPRQSMINAFKIAGQLGLPIRSYNIFGAPCETRESIMDTIELNRILKPSSVQATILTPYKGTKIYNDMLQQNRLLKNSSANFHTETIIKNPNLSAAEVEAWQKTAWLYIQAPRITFPLLHLLRLLLQASPAKARQGIGGWIDKSGMVYGLYKRFGFISAVKTTAFYLKVMLQHLTPK